MLTCSWLRLPLSGVVVANGGTATSSKLIVHFAAQKVRNLLEKMPNGDHSDYGDLSDSDDEYLLDTGMHAMADPTVHDNSDESSEDEAEGADSHCGTGSVDRGYWGKLRLLDCLVPMLL